MEIRNPNDAQEAGLIGQVAQEASSFISSLNMLSHTSCTEVLEKISLMQKSANRLYDLMNNLQQISSSASCDERPMQETMKDVDSAVYTVMQFAKTAEDQEMTSELLPICKTMLDVHAVATRLQLDRL